VKHPPWVPLRRAPNSVPARLPTVTGGRSAAACGASGGRRVAPALDVAPRTLEGAVMGAEEALQPPAPTRAQAEAHASPARLGPPPASARSAGAPTVSHPCVTTARQRSGPHRAHRVDGYTPASRAAHCRRHLPDVRHRPAPRDTHPPALSHIGCLTCARRRRVMLPSRSPPVRAGGHRLPLVSRKLATSARVRAWRERIATPCVRCPRHRWTASGLEWLWPLAGRRDRPRSSADASGPDAGVRTSGA
jgi:hypothetical protein